MFLLYDIVRAHLMACVEILYVIKNGNYWTVSMIQWFHGSKPWLICTCVCTNIQNHASMHTCACASHTHASGQSVQVTLHPFGYV